MEKLEKNIKVRIDGDLHTCLMLEAEARRLKVSDIIRDALYEHILFGVSLAYAKKEKVKNANRKQ